MRIRSKFKDYYDGVGGHDTDGPLYVRNEERVEFVPNAPGGGGLVREAAELGAFFAAFDAMPDEQMADPVAISFAGTFYAFYVERRGWYPVWKDPRTLEIYDDPEAVFAAVDAHARDWSWVTTGVSQNCERLRSGRKLFLSDSQRYVAGVGWRPGYAFNMEGWEKYKKEMWPKEIPAEVHVAQGRAPVLLLTRGWGSAGKVALVRNPKLSGYDFARRVPPWRAYQEIDTYLGNELAVQVDPGTERTDDLIRDAHGFDAKSFRRDVDSRKRKQRG